MFRKLLAALVSALALAGTAQASGGHYVFTGGTNAERAQVQKALDTSAFDWNLLPQTIQVTIHTGGGSYATPGNVFFDSELLDQGRFAWGTIQHEFGHQVDFLLLNDSERAELAQSIGGTEWFPSGTPLAHSAYGSERLASLIAWSYWPSPDNSLRPRSASDEAGSMPVPAFRALLGQLLDSPAMASAPPQVKVFAPKASAAGVKAKQPRSAR
jgi:hypothetical protein